MGNKFEKYAQTGNKFAKYAQQEEPEKRKFLGKFGEIVQRGTGIEEEEARHFLAGLADMFIGVAQFATEGKGYIAPGDMNQGPISDFVRRREERLATDGIDGPRLLGNIVTGGVLTGGMATPTSMVGRIGQSAGLGALFGGTQPSTDTGERVSNTAVGGAVGAAFPPLAAAVRHGGGAVANLVGDVTPGAARRAVRELGNRVRPSRAGPTRSRAIPGDLRSGQTVEQAVGRSGDARLAGMVRAVEGRTPNEQARHLSEQAARRVATIRQQGGGKPDEPLEALVEKLKQVRKVKTIRLFNAARQSNEKVDVSNTLNIIDGVMDRRPNERELVNALQQIKRTLIKQVKETKPATRNIKQIKEGIKPTTTKTTIVPQDSAKETISASANIQAMINKKGPTGNRVNENIVEELITIRRVLDRDIRRAIPEYRQAMTRYSELSKPINRAQIAQTLEQKLVSPLSGTPDSVIPQRATQYTGAWENQRKLIAQATGFRRGTKLDRYFEEDQLVKLGNIADELQNNAEFYKLATMGKEAASEILGDTLEYHTIMNPLIRVIMIINQGLKRIGQARKKSALDQAADVFLSPNKLADLLENVSPGRRAEISRLIDQMPLEHITRVAPPLAATEILR